MYILFNNIQDLKIYCHVYNENAMFLVQLHFYFAARWECPISILSIVLTLKCELSYHFGQLYVDLFERSYKLKCQPNITGVFYIKAGFGYRLWHVICSVSDVFLSTLMPSLYNLSVLRSVCTSSSDKQQQQYKTESGSTRKIWIFDGNGFKTQVS